MVRVGGLGYTIDVSAGRGPPHLANSRCCGPASRSKPAKDYVVPAGPASTKAPKGPPIWDVVTRHVQNAAHRGAARDWPRTGCGCLKNFCRTYANSCMIGGSGRRPMNDNNKIASRRAVLRGGLAGGAAVLAGPSLPAARAIQSGEPAAQRAGLEQDARRRRRRAPLRHAVQIRGACRPPRRGVADCLAAKLGQLHAAARARRHHHAQRALLRAPSCRHRRDQSRRPPADAPRPGRQAADFHAGRHQAHAARQPHLFPANAPPIPAWNGAAPSSTAASTPTAWCIA